MKSSNISQINNDKKITTLHAGTFKSIECNMQCSKDYLDFDMIGIKRVDLISIKEEFDKRNKYKLINSGILSDLFLCIATTFLGCTLGGLTNISAYDSNQLAFWFLFLICPLLTMFFLCACVISYMKKRSDNFLEKQLEEKVFKVLDEYSKEE